MNFENSFLPVLPKDEEATLIKLVDTDKTARDKLIEHNLRLVAHVVKKYHNYKDISGDLIGIGTIGLIKAVENFNEEKNTRLATYAARCIDNEILMFLRHTKKYQNDVSIQEPIGTDSEGNEIKIEDKLAYEGYSIEEEVQNKVYKKIINDLVEEKLKGRERTIIEYRYGLGGRKELTQREISEKLGISRSYVSAIGVDLPL